MDVKMNLVPLFFKDHLPPEGYLTEDMACHACWYYFMIATNAKAGVGKGPEDQTIEYNAEAMTDVPLWRDKYYNQQAKSIAFLYGLESPDAMFKFWPNVKMECFRLGFAPPADEIVNLRGHDRIT